MFVNKILILIISILSISTMAFCGYSRSDISYNNGIPVFAFFINNIKIKLNTGAVGHGVLITDENKINIAKYCKRYNAKIIESNSLNINGEQFLEKCCLLKDHQVENLNFSL